MPQNQNEVKAEMAEHFGERVRGSKYFEDYSLIGSFLSGLDYYLAALRQLESELEEEFDARLERLGINFQHEYRQPKNAKTLKWYKEWLFIAHEQLAGAKPREDQVLEWRAYQLFKKLLSTVLARNEMKHGFRLEAESDKIPIIIGLDGRAFNQLLKDRKPFKDIGAGPEHGEYSHRIQWFLVSRCGQLGYPAGEIYEKIRQWGTQKVFPGLGRKSYMWEFLFDRDGVPSNAESIPFKTEEQLDFRAPSNVNRALKDGQLLHMKFVQKSLADRFSRRRAMNPVEYLLKKLGMPSEKRESLLDHFAHHPGEMMELLNRHSVLRR